MRKSRLTEEEIVAISRRRGGRPGDGPAAPPRRPPGDLLPWRSKYATPRSPSRRIKELDERTRSWSGCTASSRSRMVQSGMCFTESCDTGRAAPGERGRGHGASRGAARAKAMWALDFLRRPNRDASSGPQCRRCAYAEANERRSITTDRERWKIVLGR